MGRELRLVIHGRERVDTDHGMNGRDSHGDIAHVGRARRGLTARIRETTAQRFSIVAVQGCQVEGVEHFGIRLGATGDFQVGAGGEGTSLKTMEHLGAQFF